MADKKRERFLKLRAVYLVKKGLLDEQENSLRAKYGSGMERHWLKADDGKKADAAMQCRK